MSKLPTKDELEDLLHMSADFSWHEETRKVTRALVLLAREFDELYMNPDLDEALAVEQAAKEWASVRLPGEEE
jgi:hypothetical protein